jgi:hypothetical protein
MRSVQAWEGGVSYPGAESLKALIGCYLHMGGFDSGREMAQAEALWSAARQEASRLRPPFGAAWFTNQMRTLHPGERLLPADCRLALSAHSTRTQQLPDRKIGVMPQTYLASSVDSRSWRRSSNGCWTMARGSS